MVATEPSHRSQIPAWKNHGSRRGKTYSNKPGNNWFNRRPSKDGDDSVARWRRAEQTERQLEHSLNTMRTVMKSREEWSNPSLVFPSVRDCNAALAAFGDGGELLRALRLFVKMRKAASLAQNCRKTRQNFSVKLQSSVPAPTLVTYSTLMSRAVQARKPRVALRLWRLMTMQADFFANVAKKQAPPPSSSTSTIDGVATPMFPDVKAANILMNAYAKLADVESAKDLLSQMLYGNGTDVPRMTPNLVTYNTLLDACHKAGELDHALAAKQQLDDSGLVPDARTYTSLIATVARKPSTASGAHDPTMAFALLQEMSVRGVRPNGMTYSALIDVCGRCRRSDLALKGLRIMLRQKNKERKGLQQSSTGGASQKYALSNEVGAWTAAINACGKAARLETALRLFYAMPNFGVKPNTVTCGCLTDCLLRNSRTAETLDVLRYMKREGIAPSEVMYTSLMTSAGRLAEAENKRQWEDERRSRHQSQETSDEDSLEEPSVDPNEARAIEMYTELMTTLMRGTKNNQRALQQRQSYDRQQYKTSRNPGSKGGGVVDDSNTLLVKVFLVFQEMKAAGAQPDLACYNALMRACARAGDISRAQDVLNLIRADGLDPNDNTWREMIRAAAKVRRSDTALSFWKAGLAGSDEVPHIQWKPSVISFGALISAYLRHASSLDLQTDRETKEKLYLTVMSMYRLTGANKSRLFPVDRDELHRNQRTMLLILRAVVSLEHLYALEEGETRKDLEQISKLQYLGTSIVSLECFREEALPPSLRDGASLNALHRARSWLITDQ